MKLKTFRIKNIKSIIDSGVCHLASDNITIFAGQNESGKSAVLEALRYFSNGIDENFKKYSMRHTKGSVRLLNVALLYVTKEIVLMKMKISVLY